MQVHMRFGKCILISAEQEEQVQNDMQNIDPALKAKQPNAQCVSISFLQKIERKDLSVTLAKNVHYLDGTN